MQEMLTAAKRSFQAGQKAFRREWLIVAAAFLLAWFAGSAVAAGGTRAVLALLAGMMALGASLIWAVARTRPAARFCCDRASGLAHPDGGARVQAA
jgi:hypothetical protein